MPKYSMILSKVISMKLMKNLYLKASSNRKKIVLPEGEEERTILAAAKILKDNIVSIVLIGNKETILNKALALNVNLNNIEIINPIDSQKTNMYANYLYELRKAKGLSLDDAKKMVLDNVYYGTMMVKLGDADGMVSGAIHTTGETLKPALQIIKTAPNNSIVSSFFIMMVPNSTYGNDGLFLFADCAINPNPNAQELADIAIQTAQNAKLLLDIDSRIALLSFSTKGSAEHENVKKVRDALSIVKASNQSFEIDGELQLDAAIIPEVALRKAPGSKVAGHANVLIFPDLQAGNIGYKLVERLAKAEAIGPICQGFAKPINDLSRGCSVDDIVNVVVITAVQAQSNN